VHRRDTVQGKPALMFAHLKNKTDGTPSASSPARACHALQLTSPHVTRSYSKDETEKIAFEWQSLLVSAAKGGEPSTYVIEPGIILWSVQVPSLPIFRTITSMRPASSTPLACPCLLIRTGVASRRSNICPP
jgi:hypothetical protein